MSLETADSTVHSGPRRRLSPPRLRTRFLRAFERSGSLAEAAARAGITPRTVQRWRSRDPRFARRYNEVIEQQEAILGDIAIRRANSTGRRVHIYHGKEVASVERHNDQMLRFVLSRFDRAHDRAARSRDFEAEVARRVAEETRELHSVIKARSDQHEIDLRTKASTLAEEKLQKLIEKLSPSMRQALLADDR